MRIESAARDFDCCEFPCSRYLCSLLVGVGHNPESVTSVGRIDGTSRDNGRPAGVADGFHVSKHSVEPVLANRCRNLFSHPDSGPSGTEQAKLVGPQVPLVVVSEPLSCRAERLARTAASPELAVVRPASKSSCKGPSADAGEEVALGESDEVFGMDIDDAPGVDLARR